MNKQNLPAFMLMGIEVKTTNENGQAAKDIPALWNRFMEEGIMDKIPNKIDNSIYCVYTDYEKDFTAPYTTVLACKVASIDDAPDGMRTLVIPAADYVQFVAKGNLAQGAVYQEWTKIWQTDLPRTYTADFEIYGEKSQQPDEAEVDIFIAIHNNYERN